MQSRIAFCIRCRGMRVGFNRRYILHSVSCREWRRHSSRLLSLGVLTVIVFLAFPEPSKSVFSGDTFEPPKQESDFQERATSAGGPAVRTIDAFLHRYSIPERDRSRLAEAIVTSGRKYDLDPRLIASVIVVESRGNPFAISGKDAIGIMQIHLPTWGHTAVREGFNLLKIEDNVDFGARILKGYVRQFGIWDGVKRYIGFVAEDPVSERSAQEYVEKVQRVFGMS
jgi:hypothetical protein